MRDRGRKPKEPVNADVLRTMAVLLEGGICKSARAAASAAIEQLSYPLEGAKRSSVVDRLRRAYAKQEKDLRIWARADIEQKNRRAAPKPIRRSSPLPIANDASESAAAGLAVLDSIMGRDSAVEAALEHMRIVEDAIGLTRSLRAVTAHHEIMNRAIRDYDEVTRAFRKYEDLNRASYGPFVRRRGR